MLVLQHSRRAEYEVGSDLNQFYQEPNQKPKVPKFWKPGTLTINQLQGPEPRISGFNLSKQW